MEGQNIILKTMKKLFVNIIAIFIVSVGQLSAQTRGSYDLRYHFTKPVSQQELIQAIKNNDRSKMNSSNKTLVSVIAEDCRWLNILNKWNVTPQKPSYNTVLKILAVADTATVVWRKFQGIESWYLDRYGNPIKYYRASREKELVLVYMDRYIYSLSFGEPLLDTRVDDGVVRAGNIKTLPPVRKMITKTRIVSKKVIPFVPESKSIIEEEMDVEESTPEPEIIIEEDEEEIFDEEAVVDETEADTLDEIEEDQENIEDIITSDDIEISDELMHRPAEEETDEVEETFEGDFVDDEILSDSETVDEEEDQVNEEESISDSETVDEVNDSTSTEKAEKKEKKPKKVREKKQKKVKKVEKANPKIIV